MVIRIRKKVILLFLAVSLLTGLLFLCVASPLTKYLVEKYDVRFTGRQITVGRAYVNPFTGTLYLKNFCVYEQANPDVPGDSVRAFLSVKRLRINFALFKLLSKTCEITELSLDEPRGLILQNKNRFNFDDLV